MCQHVLPLLFPHVSPELCLVEKGDDSTYTALMDSFMLHLGMGEPGNVKLGKVLGVFLGQIWVEIRTKFKWEFRQKLDITMDGT